MNYEDQLERFYCQLDLRGATVVDVGANVGRHTLPLSHQVGVEGLVHAFEPVPSLRRDLNARLTEASVNNVVVYPFALASSRCVAEFNFIPNLPEESGLKQRHVYNGVPDEFVKFQVGVFTLDELIGSNQATRFVKIDVEGGELDVLGGATSLLRIARPIVAFECGAGSYLGYHDRPDRIFDIFHSGGYEIHSLTGLHMHSVQAFAQATVEQKFWDYVAFPMESRQLSHHLRASA